MRRVRLLATALAALTMLGCDAVTAPPARALRSGSCADCAATRPAPLRVVP